MKQILIRMDDHTYEAYRAATLQDGSNMTRTARHLIAQWLEARGAMEPEDMRLTPAEVRTLEQKLDEPPKVLPRLQKLLQCEHPKARRSKGGLCMACGANAG